MKIKCCNSECKREWEDDVSFEENELAYCSVECAVYDGVFSVKSGWNAKAVAERKRQLFGDVDTRDPK